MSSIQKWTVLLLGVSAFFVISSTRATALDLKVFLQGGQSNALGRAPSSGLATSPVDLQQPQDDVLFYYGSTLTTLRPGSGKFTTEFGPEVTFGRSIADADPTTDYAIIKYALGGTALYNDWAPTTGAQYIAFQNTVASGLAALQAAGHTTEIVGMIWHQGESDAIEGQQANYEANLTAFIADMRSQYGADLPFLIGEIRRSNGAAFVTVADAQIAVAAADPNTAFVPASDLSFLDIYHFDAAGQQTLGERFAQEYATLIGDQTTPDWITGVTIEDVSSEFSAIRSAENIINGSGFDEANGFHSSANGDNISWNNAGVGLGQTPGDDPLPAFDTIDLEGVYDLDVIKIWNWNTSNTLTAGTDEFQISVAPSETGAFTTLGNFNLAQAPGSATIDFGEVFDLSSVAAADSVRLVRLDLVSNHGFDFELAGFCEVRLSGTALETFATYIANPAFGLALNEQGFTDDPDGDGISNGLEAWFGSDPTSPGAGLIAGSIDSVTTAFSHAQNPTPPVDLSVSYEWSTNLINWYASGFTNPSGVSVTLAANTVGTTTSVAATASEPLDRVFFRALAEQE